MANVTTSKIKDRGLKPGKWPLDFFNEGDNPQLSRPSEGTKKNGGPDPVGWQVLVKEPYPNYNWIG